MAGIQPGPARPRRPDSSTYRLLQHQDRLPVQRKIADMVLTQPKASYCWPLTLGAGVLCWAGFAVGSPSANLSRPSFPHVGWGLGFPPGHSLGFGVILRPDSLKFVQVVGTQDGPVPRQVVKVVHDDGYEEVDDLQKMGAESCLSGPSCTWGCQGHVPGGQGSRKASHMAPWKHRTPGRGSPD